MTLAININRRAATVIIGALIGLFSLSLVAISSAHGGNNSANLVHACVLNTLNTVRIVSSGTACALGETATHWNAEGLPGTGGFVSNLQDALLDNSDLRYRSFANQNLTGAYLNASKLQRTDFTNANLTNVNLSYSDLGYASGLQTATLAGNTFDYAYLGNTNLSGVDLTGATITNAVFEGANLAGTDFSGLDLSGANFSNANLSSAILTGVDWNNTICPDNTNSDNNGDTCTGHLTP
jgi:uncharacterized protein YjbI with pentapeptide repeats